MKITFKNGEKIPSVDIYNLEGQKITIESFLGKPQLFIFLRHLMCLSCQEHLHQVKAHLHDFKAKNMEIRVFSFADVNSLKQHQAHFQWPFPLYANPDRSLYRAFKLKKGSFTQIFHPKAVIKQFFYTLKGQKLKKPIQDIYQLGGDFLINAKGEVVFEHRSQHPEDRPSWQRLLKI
ncbi:MAG: AhpC/TSA family protein [Deltaproteobacteria bacterium]|nr:AhpC/TSA family protein [Deltaproteobacteria bacterium]